MSRDGVGLLYSKRHFSDRKMRHWQRKYDIRLSRICRGKFLVSGDYCDITVLVVCNLHYFASSWDFQSKDTNFF
jgi:hypothetical protein